MNVHQFVCRLCTRFTVTVIRYLERYFTEEMSLETIQHKNCYVKAVRQLTRAMKKHYSCYEVSLQEIHKKFFLHDVSSQSHSREQ